MSEARHLEPRQTRVVLSAEEIARYWLRVDKRDPHECWPWTRGRTKAGYGQFYLRGRREYAHRVGFLIANGWLPAETLHSCDNPPCQNPAHLLDGTHVDNVMDMYAKGRARVGVFQRSRTHCKNGHPFTPENTRVYIRGGTERRACRRCVAAAQRRYKRRRAQA